MYLVIQVALVLTLHTHTMCSQSCFFGIGLPWARNVTMVFLLGHASCLEFGVTLGFSMGHGFMEQMAIWANRGLWEAF